MKGTFFVWCEGSDHYDIFDSLDEAKAAARLLAYDVKSFPNCPKIHYGRLVAIGSVDLNEVSHD